MTDAPSPAPLRAPVWFEDLVPGAEIRTEGATISEASILDFAARWDPQPFHLDVEAAKGSIFGGLIASGFQTMMTAFRLLHAEKVMNPASQGSPGMESVRWLAPVRPGDTIRMVATVLEARVSASRPQLGIVRWHYSVLNQRDEAVMDWVSSGMFLRAPAHRPEATPGAGT
ncbi:MAG: acyl dehydratase [Rhodobacteraceae bacterium]|nr:acyl dehydratase [Paracoccaceae bacterium]MBR27116.1 acyl dehydratase [Paracoccaceae bacterium]